MTSSLVPTQFRKLMNIVYSKRSQNTGEHGKCGCAPHGMFGGDSAAESLFLFSILRSGNSFRSSQ